MRIIRTATIFILFVFLAGPVFPGSIEITKVGEWGTSYYEGVFVQGNYAYCAALYAGLDVIDISSKEHPVKIGNYDTWASERAAVYSVYVKGNYAYLAFSDGLMILDISNPASPALTGKYDLSVNYNATGVYLEGNYAYITSGGAGLYVIDVSNPASPVPIGNYDTYWASGVYVKDNYAYITDHQDGLMIIDVSDPASLTLTGTCDETGGRGLYVRGNYAYLANGYDGLDIVDVSEAASPKRVGNLNTPGAARNVLVRGNYAYVADYSTGLMIVDVSEPSLPGLAGSFNTIGTAWGGLFLLDDYVFVADFDHGLQIIDISDPASPTWVGSYDKSGMAEGVFVKGNYAYLADGHSGLRIIDVSVPSAPAQVGNYDTRGRALGVYVSDDHAYIVDDREGLRIINTADPTSPVFAGGHRTPSPARDVYVSGNYAYVTTRSTGLLIFDVSRPSLPIQVGNYDTDGQANGVHVRGDYAYVACDKNFLVIDVSDPSSPTPAGSCTTPGVAEDLYVTGAYAYVANGNKGLQVIDIEDPTAPGIVANCNISGYAKNLHVAGTHAYVASESRGLAVIDIEDPTAPKGVFRHDTTGLAHGVYVSGYLAYVADGLSGKLLVFKILEQPPTSPFIALNHEYLNFGADRFGPAPDAQTLLIDNDGPGTMNWSVETDRNWLLCTPPSGTDAGTLSVSIDASGLPAGAYQGTITVSSPDAVNSPLSMPVNLKVYAAGQTSGPFGSFDSPVEGSTVCSSVPFTGWVLDDTGVESVKLYRQEGKGLVYIGDSVFVEGARPDIETLYNDYPNNYKAGWGYMMLTNFLPNGGNGTFTIHAVATDNSGNQVTLGTKTITADNANAIKPFGAIDTPTQGGEAYGENFADFGWVLTPLPNTIPPDGSTINVWVDGELQPGNPVYNGYREDIAELLPGYNNSGGAGGHYSLDTTRFANGVHIIAWSVVDDAGNSDGIGSRYFTILNPGNRQRAMKNREKLPLDISSIPVDDSHPVQIIKGDDNTPSLDVYPGDKDIIDIDIKELERIEIRFPGTTWGLSRLPTGSFLDTGKNIFYWQPGPGFLGEYLFSFLEKGSHGDLRKKYIKIVIHPKFSDI